MISHPRLGWLGRCFVKLDHVVANLCLSKGENEPPRQWHQGTENWPKRSIYEHDRAEPLWVITNKVPHHPGARPKPKSLTPSTNLTGNPIGASAEQLGHLSLKDKSPHDSLIYAARHSNSFCKFSPVFGHIFV